MSESYERLLWLVVSDLSMYAEPSKTDARLAFADYLNEIKRDPHMEAAFRWAAKEKKRPYYRWDAPDDEPKWQWDDFYPGESPPWSSLPADLFQLLPGPKTPALSGCQVDPLEARYFTVQEAWQALADGFAKWKEIAPCTPTH